MEIKCFVLDGELSVFVKHRELWRSHYIRGEEVTNVKNFNDTHWKNIKEYLFKSLGKAVDSEITTTFVVYDVDNKCKNMIQSGFTKVKFITFKKFLSSKKELIPKLKQDCGRIHNFYFSFKNKEVITISADDKVEIFYVAEILNGVNKELSKPELKKAKVNYGIIYPILQAKEKGKLVKQLEKEVSKTLAGFIDRVTGSAYYITVPKTGESYYVSKVQIGYDIKSKLAAKNTVKVHLSEDNNLIFEVELTEGDVK